MAFCINRKRKSISLNIDASLQDRLEGCFLGQAIGDALGALYEGMTSKKATELVGKNMENGFLPIKGINRDRTTFNPGQVTNDTELALALARSMVRKGTYCSDDVADSYVNWWLRDACEIGLTTLRTMRGVDNIQGKSKRLQQMLVNSSTQNQTSLSNGCLMRISPLAVGAYSWKLEVLQHVARCNCFLTNPNPTAQDAVACHVTALHAALHGSTKGEIFDAGRGAAKQAIMKDHFEDAKRCPQPIKLKLDSAGYRQKLVQTDSRG